MYFTLSSFKFFIHKFTRPFHWYKRILFALNNLYNFVILIFLRSLLRSWFMWFSMLSCNWALTKWWVACFLLRFLFWHNIDRHASSSMFSVFACSPLLYWIYAWRPASRPFYGVSFIIYFFYACFSNRRQFCGDVSRMGRYRTGLLPSYKLLVYKNSSREIRNKSYVS